jgi:mono/diheme cytochrome c family protein
MKARYSFAATVLGALVACAASLPQPTQADAVKAATRWPGTTRVDLEQGRRLYVDKCAGCHALKAPSELPPELWESKVAEMRREHEVVLSDVQARSIVAYLYGVGSR